MHTGEKIRSIRVLKGLSQENMAEMLNMSILAYGNLERGTSNVSKERLVRIAEILNVTVDFIRSFGERIQYIFDQCSGPIFGVNSENVQNTNNNDARELQHENEKLQLQIEKLKLEIEKITIEKEKVELELKFYREKIVSDN
ncbi:helix-turn-helix domain-containing protein [Emticicia sp. BO119]|uniref:helix-turn-helix domain-containing protein n=1 Tax=Emticicia sp. BO119 TaxID=2757768 RepID=UPI0015F0A4AA|nr:helix-turn-helix transcriptional regulator [Emticicia sp. BO119]MBA4853420.1 helix-turn-helix domain-containing protein [Emticicia sp. BO119]